MEIYVRSQDKKWFGKVKGFSVLSVNNEKYCAICKDNFEGIILGRYSSKERCIEIIDEIQKLYSLQYRVVVFEMPEE